jgi:hypothetical protein
MIEFLTLFLGIVAGPQQVSLLADPQVVSIELRLDGESLTRIETPPCGGHHPGPGSRG